MIALRPESKKQIDEGISQTQLGTPEDWFTDILSSFEDDNQLHRKEVFHELSMLILSNVLDFCSTLGVDFEEYDVQCKDMWVNIITNKMGIDKHDHAGDFLSTCYYHTAPEGSAPLVINNPVHDIFLSSLYSTLPKTMKKEGKHKHNLSQVNITPKPGMLVVFPSYLSHGVKLNYTDEPRISFSQNFIINPKK
tara:strand:- start:523 stop:1101 length:579 start_codon:yes stop_codon:yes gene_type:complete